MELFPAFAPELAHVDLRGLDEGDDIAYAVDAGLRIRYTNAAWRRAAADRGAAAIASVLGASVLDACTPRLRPFYAALYQRAAQEPEVISHEYLCSTPRHQQRFRMMLRGLLGGGVLVTHHLVHRAPHACEAREADEAAYRGEAGLITQCAHCRLTRRADQRGWSWVPGFVAEQPERTSHGICPPCFSLYFPTLAARRFRE